jgi:ribosomal protein S27AE
MSPTSTIVRRRDGSNEQRTHNAALGTTHTTADEQQAGDRARKRCVVARFLATAGEQGPVNQPMMESQVVQCTECGQVYIGGHKQNGGVVPRGRVACSHCGSETFEHLTLADLGLD